MVDPNRAFKDRNRPVGTNTIDVRHVDNATVTCARCGRFINMNLRGISNLDLSKVKCSTCWQHNVGV